MTILKMLEREQERAAERAAVQDVRKARELALVEQELVRVMSALVDGGDVVHVSGPKRLKKQRAGYDGTVVSAYRLAEVPGGLFWVWAAPSDLNAGKLTRINLDCGIKKVSYGNDGGLIPIQAVALDKSGLEFFKYVVKEAEAAIERELNKHLSGLRYGAYGGTRDAETFADRLTAALEWDDINGAEKTTAILLAQRKWDADREQHVADQEGYRAAMEAYYREFVRLERARKAEYAAARDWFRAEVEVYELTYAAVADAEVGLQVVCVTEPEPDADGYWSTIDRYGGKRGRVRIFNPVAISDGRTYSTLDGADFFREVLAGGTVIVCDPARAELAKEALEKLPDPHSLERPSVPDTLTVVDRDRINSEAARAVQRGGADDEG